MAERKRFHQLDGAQRDGFGDGQQPGRAPLSYLLDGKQFGLVAHASQHFQITHGRQREHIKLIKPAHGLSMCMYIVDTVPANFRLLYVHLSGCPA